MALMGGGHSLVLKMDRSSLHVSQFECVHLFLGLLVNLWRGATSVLLAVNTQCGLYMGEMNSERIRQWL